MTVYKDEYGRDISQAEWEEQYGHKSAATRERILYTGARLTSGDRNKTYGEPVENMQDIAALWQAYLDRKRVHGEGHIRLTGEDVAHMMSLMKMARTLQPRLHADNYLDSTVYQAIAGECAEQERGNSA